MMKLLVQADDYGMTPAVAQGIIHGIKNGLIRNTGMFANMPWAEECVEWVKPYFNVISFGIDLNISTGRPLSNPKDIPTLTDDGGSFYSSRKSRSLDSEENGFEHAAKEELYREFDAQLKQFVKLVGRKPDYIHGHAYNTPGIEAVQRELAKQYEVPFTSDVWKRITGVGVSEYRIGWYKKPPTLENQRDSLLKDYILENSDEILGKDYFLLVGHMGYVDRQLMDYSSYTLYRMNDLDAVTAPEIIRWVEDNQVELITYQNM